MLVSFPQMGTMHLPLTTLFTRLGVDVLAPPITKKTLELGVKYSPETVCLPFKIGLGNFIEALTAGADTLVTCGGVGPCRLGYYAEVQKSILCKLGFDFSVIVLEPDIVSLLKAVHSLFPGRSWVDIYRAVSFAWQVTKSLDRMETQLCRLRPYVIPGSLEELWRSALSATASVQSAAELKTLEQAFMYRIAQRKLPVKKRPLRLGVVGEIYAMREPFVNYDLMRRLGDMGVDVYPSMCLSNYVRVHLLKKQPFYWEYQQSLRLAAPFLGQNVGGHGRDGIGQSIKLALDGFDGVIQVLPFTCMPEIISKNILPQISKIYDIPVLSLTFDEQSGEAGLITRLEAFVDLLHFRRDKCQDSGD